ncbi:HAUS augmin-like complex subunit 2 isoform 1-T1 [Synchiropus picturatus]
MKQSDVHPFTVTPAAALISRCVSSGLLSQEEVDSHDQGPAFSSRLYQVEQNIRMQKELDELRLELELLQLEKSCADVTHPFYLSQRFQMLQQFCTHLQEVLKEQQQLRQRLMRPLASTNLPVQADLHRFVVDSVKMMLNFIESLEEKLDIVRTRPTATENLTRLSSSLAQVLDQVYQLQTLTSQILQWKEVGSGLLSDSST